MEELKNAKVSIVTPLFNSEHYVEETIKSVLEQTHENWEWVIVDDMSIDNSYKIVHAYASKDNRIILLRNRQNLGAALSRNIGIIAATGQFLTFIDSDDLWFPEFIENSLKTVNDLQCGFVFSSYERWNETMTRKYDTFIVPKKINYTNLLYTCPISCLTAFIDIHKYGKILMPNIKKRQDFALWLEYLKIIPFAVGNKKPLAKYRIRENSLSRRKSKVISYQFNVYYNHQKLGLLKSVFFLVCWAVNGMKKYSKI